MGEPQLSAGRSSLGADTERRLPPLELVSFTVDIPSDKGSDAALTNNRGVQAAAEGRYQEALDLYNEALLLNPHLSAAQGNRANALVQLGRLEEALLAYRDAFAIEPQAALVHYNFGSALLDAKNYPAAIEQFQAALSGGPHHSNVYLNLAMALAGMERHEAAIGAYDEAIRLDHANASALSGRGISWARLGHLDRAITSQQDALRELTSRPNPDKGFLKQIYQSLSDYHIELSKFSQALAIVDAALQRFPSDPDFHFRRGATLAEEGRLSEAVDAYQGAIELSPHFSNALNNRGGALLQLERYDEAIASFVAAIDSEPRNALAHFNLGLAYGLTGNPNQAIAHLQDAIEIGMNTAPALAELGIRLFEVGKLDEAKNAYLQAEALEPGDPMIAENLGLILSFLGKAEEAEQKFRRALELNPELIISRSNLTKLLIDAGRFSEAKIELDEIIMRGNAHQHDNNTEEPIRNINKTSKIENNIVSVHLSEKSSEHDFDQIDQDGRMVLSANIDSDPLMLAKRVLADERQIPINVAAFVAARDIQMFLVNFNDSQGKTSQIVRVDENNTHIYIADYLSREWKRFYLAEKFYTVLVDPAIGSGDTASDAMQPVNNVDDAKRFACELLMPSDAVAQCWPGIRDREAMAVLFDVPVLLMSARIHELGLDQREPGYDQRGRGTGDFGSTSSGGYADLAPERDGRVVRLSEAPSDTARPR